MATQEAGVRRPSGAYQANGRLGVGGGRATLDTGAEAVTGALVESPVADDDVATPDETAMAAWCTVAQAARPP